MSPQKVYVINLPRRSATPKSKKSAAGRRAARASRNEFHVPPRAKSNSRLPALRAYALGPLSLILWPTGENRTTWAIVGAASLVAAALLWMGWDAFLNVLGRFESGPVIWTVSVALVMLALATAWARAVATSELPASWPRSLRRSSVVCALGLVLPGRGLLIAGRRRKAAFAIWCAGLLVAAVAIVNQWRWLAADGAGGGDGPAHQTIEMILGVAAGCTVLGSLVWLVMALDGVRAVSPVARQSATADSLALAFLVTIVFFAVTFRPAPVARSLESAAEELRRHGLRTIPVALYEAASMLDPATPTYLAGAAELYDDLGRSETANAKRDLLEKRASQFADAIGADLVPGHAHEAPLPWTPGLGDSTGYVSQYDLRW